MQRLATALAIVAAVSGGCTITRTVQRPERVEDIPALYTKHRFHMTLLHQRPEGATSAVPPTLGMVASADPGDEGPPIGDISNLRGYEVKRRGLGALEGLALGTVLGFVGGALIGLSMGSDGPCEPNDTHFACIRFDAEEKALLIGGTGAIGGHALGAIIGALVGHTDRYVFSP